jgi:hypothetical protein
VLSRDIRSLNQRLIIHPVGSKAQQKQQRQEERQRQRREAAGAGGGAAAGAGAAGAGGPDSGPDARRGRYIVVLDGMDVTYDLGDDGTVLLRGVYPLGGGVPGGEELAAEAMAAAARQRQAVGMP